MNNELVIVPMIETNQSLENLDAIASVPGVDVLLIGPSDLSIELEVPLDYPCDTYQRALDKIAATAAKHGIAAGMYFIPPEMDPNFFVQKGFKFFTMPGAPGRRPGSRTAWPGSSANDGRRGRSGALFSYDLVGVDSSQKVDLSQWRLWLAARSKGDRQLPARSGHWTNGRLRIGSSEADRPDCAHCRRSDERYRFSEAVIHGRRAKWLGWVESGRSMAILVSCPEFPHATAPNTKGLVHADVVADQHRVLLSTKADDSGYGRHDAKNRD